LPIGTPIDIQGSTFNAGNKGFFLVTGSGINYFEITNASGVAEVDKILDSGYINKGTSWSKPSGLKYIEIELQAGGGGGGAGNISASGGGGGGGYAKKLISSSSLLSIEYLVVGRGGDAETYNNQNSTKGGNSLFQITSSIIANGGTNAQRYSGGAGGAGGTATGGDINITGKKGGYGKIFSGTGDSIGGAGGSSMFSGGTPTTINGYNGETSLGYGGGGAGGSNKSGVKDGGSGSAGLIIIKEYFY